MGRAGVVGLQGGPVHPPLIPVLDAADAVGEETVHVLDVEAGQRRIGPPAEAMLEPIPKGSTDGGGKRIQSLRSVGTRSVSTRSVSTRSVGTDDADGQHRPIGNLALQCIGHDGTKTVADHERVVDVELIEHHRHIGDVVVDTGRRPEAPRRAPSPKIGGDDRETRRHTPHHEIPGAGVHRSVVE